MNNKFFLVFAVFAAMVFFSSCGSSKENIYDNVDSSDSTDEMTDSDNTSNTNSDDADSQSEDSSSDFEDSMNNDSDDLIEYEDPDDSDNFHFDDDSDTAEDENPCKNNPCVGITNSTEICIPEGTKKYSCGCTENYNWNGSQCVAATIQSDCTNLPDNAVWNTASSIIQTWNGTEWKPTTSAIFSEIPSTTECFFKCAENYDWKDSQCTAGTKESDCIGLPLKAHWNTATKIMQTWSGSEWIPSNIGSFNNSASDSECYFQCDEHYTWNTSTSTCDADTQSATCIGLPENASWNSVSEITQTWNGSNWAPSNTASFSNSASNSECYFKCYEHYTWNPSNSVCDADTQTAICFGLPENAIWNNVSFITQTWNGSEWTPSNIASFSDAESSTECLFKCHEHYTWNLSTSTCDADTQSEICIGLPENASWNNVAEITQIWNGSEWTPSAIGSYNETASSEECRYKCDNDYHWESPYCVSNTRTNVECTDLPTGAVWNTVSSITQTWNSENAWQPSTTATYNTEESSSECRYKCDPAYIWENDNCINQRTAACTELPENAEWNIASEITQNWTGTEWIPTTTGSFETNSSTEECIFKCKENYTWTDSICKADSKISECEELPEHAHWNTAESISQTWNGSEWIPSAIGTFSTEESTSECYFKCDNYYQWNGSSCVVPLARICVGEKIESCTSPECSIDDTVPDEPTVIENNTKLEWLKDVVTNKTWDEAVIFCDELIYGGHDDWRLPIPQELLTIKNSVNTYFPDILPLDGNFWSATSCSDSPLSAFSVNVKNGTVGRSSKNMNTNHQVKCVRGNKLPYPIFTDTGNIVIDPINNLRWQKNHDGGKNWQAAISYCENHGMRLPNNNELASLMNYEKDSPTPSDFPGTINRDWSSTSYSNTMAYIIFSNGRMDSTSKTPSETYTIYTRCVDSIFNEGD